MSKGSVGRYYQYSGDEADHDIDVPNEYDPREAVPKTISVEAAWNVRGGRLDGIEYIALPNAIITSEN